MGFYKNAIFDKTGTEHEEESYEENYEEGESYEEEGKGGDESFEKEEEERAHAPRGDQTTLITWPPTNEDQDDSAAEDSKLQPSAEHKDASISNITSNRTSTTSFFDSGILETQTQSFDYSDGESSIARFPTFHFNIHTLASLSFHGPGAPHNNRGPGPNMLNKSSARKVNLLLAILEVDGPETITIKKGPDAGKQVALLKMILGDEKGGVGKLSAWREVAEVWSGMNSGRSSMACKRGDVVYLENVLLDASDPASSPLLTASPNLKSALTICYRTMPYNVQEDHVFRSDLRLGESDPCVRKVAAVVRWFEGMAGLVGAKYGPAA
ncbi:hypothetical protein EST38_g2780 [Candolleomyces aberdarensis]|uniref:Uncharacterized protein n=1 Tax=Candolleomyces aberdarensis TaxID=2316362 RepID=A0A4Q2DS61_9AGAR|nr:hypothetical protein EST38_g2780 [Candolleomyces aberdarensis]